MQEKEYGIILRRFATSQHKVSTLTNGLGKIALVVFSQQALYRIQLGSLVEFIAPQQNNNVYTTPQLVVVTTPIAHNTQDLAWLHHMLELCYYFIPLNQPAEECFIALNNSLALLQCANLFVLAQWNMLKKLCLGVLLLFLGFFPPRYLEQPIVTTKDVLLSCIGLSDEPKIERIQQFLQTFTTISCSDLDAWLLESIQSHPRAHTFKTVPLIYPSTQSFK